MTFNNDPTYIKEEIDKKPIWKLAFIMSEVDNDNAPIGWSKYINLATWTINKFKIPPEKI